MDCYFIPFSKKASLKRLSLSRPLLTIDSRITPRKPPYNSLLPLTPIHSIFPYHNIPLGRWLRATHSIWCVTVSHCLSMNSPVADIPQLKKPIQFQSEESLSKCPYFGTPATHAPPRPDLVGANVPPVRLVTRTNPNRAGVYRCRRRSFVSRPANDSLAGRAASSG